VKKTKKLFCAALLPICVASCDCHQNVSGQVLDISTKKPIDSVYIHKVGNSYGEYSDSTGKFAVTAISGGLFGCPAMQVAFNKDGYDFLSEEIDNAGIKTIFLKKVK
jgi:hypothetical protein